MQGTQRPQQVFVADHVTWGYSGRALRKVRASKLMCNWQCLSYGGSDRNDNVSRTDLRTTVCLIDLWTSAQVTLLGQTISGHVTCSDVWYSALHVRACLDDSICYRGPRPN